MKAQCKDCFPKETDWKFAAGVTLYSNNLYVYNENLLERRPLEFNFRYKLAPNHVLRLNLPITFNVKMKGDPLYLLPNYELDKSIENMALAFLDGMKHDEAYSNYFVNKNGYYNLLGGSIGYDYNLNLNYRFSIAEGIDLSYFYKSYDNFYQIGYSIVDGNNKANLSYVDYVERTSSFNAFVVKPEIGLRYRFQKILLEGNVGYAFTYGNFYADMKSQSYDIMGSSHSSAYRK
jgi:hypothetical protein